MKFSNWLPASDSLVAFFYAFSIQYAIPSIQMFRLGKQKAILRESATLMSNNQAKELLSRREIPTYTDSRVGLRNIPAWAISLVFHVTLIATIGYLGVKTPAGTGDNSDREVGIAVVYQTAGGEEYFLNDSAAGGSNSQNSDSSKSSLPAESSLLDAETDSMLESLLAGSTNAGGETAEAAGGLGLGDGAAELGQGTGIPKAKTSVFGVEGEGTRFIYVFDRSASMNGQEGRPLQAAKSEIVKSLESISPVHEFQIIFYNENPLPFGGISGRGPTLYRGDEQSKLKAQRFVKDVRAVGGTKHVSALLMGLAMAPDVIFFLTDADRPALPQRTIDELQIKASRAGATIHCIQFGTGPRQGGGRWIESLATGTMGAYRYIDVLKL